MSPTALKRLSIAAALSCALASAPLSASAQNVRGFVFGEDSGGPMEGVLVKLLTRTLEHVDTTRTDLLGRFTFTARGPNRYVVVAEKEGFASAPEVIEVSAIALAQVGVTLSMTPMTTTVEEEGGDARVANIRGRVLIAGSQNGIENAEVTDLATGRSVLTRYDGRFLFGEVRPGPLRLRVDHLAYESREWAIDASPGSDYEVTIPLEEGAIPIEGIEVVVRSRAVARKLEPVFERMARNLGGMFITKPEFEQRGNPPIAQMIQGLPSVTVRGSNFRYEMNFRRGATGNQPGCAPDLWLDGVRVVRGGQSLSEFLSMSTLEVEVIELYPSPSSIPAEYQSGAFCAVGIWTRRGG